MFTRSEISQSFRGGATFFLTHTVYVYVHILFSVGIADSLSDSGYDHRKIKKAKRTDEEKKKRKKEKKKKKEKEKEDKVVFTQ